MTHTPTPWDYADRVSITAIYGKGYEKPIAIANSYPKGFGPDVGERVSNAAHIVKCVNLHDELVEALKQSLELANIAEGMTGCKSDDEYVWGIQETIRTALKKAGAL